MGLLDNVKKMVPGSKADNSWDEQLAREELDMLPSEEKYASQVDDAPAAAQSSQIDPTKLSMQVERLSAQVEALRELRTAYDEKFMHLNEEIGEVRAIAVEQEKNTIGMKTQAERAVSMMESVQPEKLYEQVKRVDQRVDILNGIQEKHEAVQKAVMEEVKEMRQKTEVLRGGEGLLRLNEEVKTELGTMRKLEGMVEQSADKVESIYLEVQKQFTEFKHFRERVDYIDSSMEALTKELKEFHSKVLSAASKTDLDEANAALKQSVKRLEAQGIEHVSEAEVMKSEIEAFARQVKELRETVKETRNSMDIFLIQAKQNSSRLEDVEETARVALDAAHEASNRINRLDGVNRPDALDRAPAAPIRAAQVTGGNDDSAATRKDTGRDNDNAGKLGRLLRW